MREDLLDEIVTKGRKRWTNVALEGAELEQYLKDRGWGEVPAPHPDDLFLACALLRGNQRACELAEQEFFPGLRAAVARIHPDDAFIDEVLQDLRAKVLTGEPPRIAQYTGRGPLGAWLRVAATRLASEHLRTRGRRRERSLSLGERPSSATSSPEQQLFRETYRRALEEAIATALSELEPRDRNVLRMHFVSGLNIDAIGKAYNVHRATVARWIARAREVLFERTRSRLTEGPLAMSESDFQSIVQLVRSEVDLCLSAVLATDPADPGDAGAQSGRR